MNDTFEKHVLSDGRSAWIQRAYDVLSKHRAQRLARENMKTHMNTPISEQLEHLIDAEGLAQVLEHIADICGEKADHIRSSYADEPLAKLWQSAGRYVASASGKDPIRAISDRR